MIRTPLLAVGFVNPALLAGLGLAALPVLIHLLSRRRYRRVEWGAMRFVLDADRRNRRRVLMEQWLLLALRCLIVALLALVVARPFLQPGMLASILGARGQVERIILLDDSASTAFRSGLESDFQRLAAAAARLLRWLKDEAPADPVTLLLTSAPDAPLLKHVRAASPDLDAAVEKLAALAPGDTRADPRRSIERLAADLAASGRHVQADVYVLSDLQRSDWIAAPPDHASVFAPLQDAERISPRLLLIAADPGPRDNAAVTALAFDRPHTLAGFPAPAHAAFTNFGPHPLRSLAPLVEADTAPLPVEPIDTLAPGESRRLPFEVSFPDEGYAQLTVSIPAQDHFNKDDLRRTAVRVASALRVLLVNGQPATDAYEDEVFLLRTALAPRGPLASGLTVETIDPEAVAAAELHAFDCVFLCNVGPLDDAAAELLRRYVAAGGGLVIFAGDEWAPVDDLNRSYGSGPGGLLPARALRIESVPPPGLGLRRTSDHAVTALFPGGDDALSDAVHFRTFVQVHDPQAQPAQSSPPEESDRAAVLARYSDPAASPAILEKRLGRGRVLLFTSTCDLQWNDWGRAADGSFVVTMLEAVQHVASRGDAAPELYAGQPLSVTLAPDEFELAARFKPPRYPDEAAVDVAYQQSGALPASDVTLTGPVARTTGFYRVELTRRGGGAESRLLAVNLDPRESDLTPASPRELEAAAGRIPLTFVSDADRFLTGRNRARNEIWTGLLAAVAALLMLEQLFAWRITAARERRASEESARRPFGSALAAWRSAPRHDSHRPPAPVHTGPATEGRP